MSTRRKVQAPRGMVSHVTLGGKPLRGAPVEEWPSGEIFAAMSRDPMLAAWIPIDILGMTTDLNPNVLYLPEEVSA
jgi:hypothetical protein